MVIVVSHISGYRRTWCINDEIVTSRDDILDVLIEKEGQTSDVVLQCSGQILTQASSISRDATIVATLRLPGGKGGFGSMLRAIGAQIEKTTNREACRDLSGRRLRDINEEKRLKDFISKKAEREREMQDRKKQKFEKLKETPKHVFQDEQYYKQREIREKNLFDSLDKAFSKEKDDGPSGVKRQYEGEAKAVARVKKGRFLDDLDESSGDSESEEESTDDSEKKGSSGSEDDTRKNKDKNSTSTNGTKQVSLNSDGEGTSSAAEDSETSSSSKENHLESKPGDSCKMEC